MVTRTSKRGNVTHSGWRSALYSFCSFLGNFLVNPAYCTHIYTLLSVIECFICVLVIENVRFTEIDWGTYMQQIEVFINGSRDYSQLVGDTGPLVYPAAHVYIYRVLHWITLDGTNIRTAQYIFAAVYVVTLCAVGRLYSVAGHVPPFVLIIMSVTSYRVHSIYLLRLFNDPLAMFLLYAAVNCMLDGWWTSCSVLYSMAVAVKMNVLLYSPCWLLILLLELGWRRAVLQLLLCAAVQLVLAAPFLHAAPLNYISAAFNLGRVFEHRWTVNWRFIDHKLFVDRRFHVCLLAMHVLVVAIFTWRRWLPQLKAVIARNKCKQCRARRLLVALFTCNLIGVAFCRSLHYQFYVWYYHTLAFLLWSVPVANNVRFLVLGIVEMCWNTYPSTAVSSALLHCAHLLLLIFLYRQSRTASASFQRCTKCGSDSVFSLDHNKRL